MRESHVLLCEFTSFIARSCHEFQQKTTKELSKLKEYMQHGWPENKYQCDSACKEYWAGRNELDLANGIIFRQGSVIVPPSMCSTVLKKFHNDSLHHSTTKTELRIKQHVYWLGITAEIKHMICRCNSCLEFQKRVDKPLHSEQIISGHPMNIVNCDVFEKDRKLFHLMTDHYSNYIWVKPMCQVTGHTVHDHLKQIFNEFGVTNILISDHATYYMGKVFEQLCNEMDIQHKPTNPHSQHQNGKAERFVGTIKDMMYKADNISVQDIVTALHKTPYSNEIQSPCRLMFNCTVKCTNRPVLQTAKEIVRKAVPGQELPPLNSDQLLFLNDHKTE